MFEAGLFAYAGFASLAVARKKHRPARPLPFLPAPGRAGPIGWTLLNLSLAIAIVQLGAAQGLVAWTGQLCVAGAAFVLLLSWQHRMAIMIGIALPFAATVFLLL
ncbi:DUF3325 family protein [Sphingobium sp. Ant17]|uniref:DUF3325 family protein n=1 Tax=Sphingobium sp. Ant17 TaxID=1461752 RepID=UPI00044AF5F1|nr:DUF3325 family protein [Sphingobium sp. Ant17]EXS69966.1 hypothetical protein BF95_07915 [Sphingobium sp. Ant17]